MPDFLLSVLSSIVGNLLTPAFKARVGLEEEQPLPPPQPRQAPDARHEAALQQRRQQMREQAEAHAWTALGFAILLGFVGAAIALPVILKTSFLSEALACADTQAASLCAGRSWSVEKVKVLLVMLWAFWVMVVWLLSQWLADPIAELIHRNWHPVDAILYIRIHALTAMFLAFVLCGHWVYFLFPEYSYWVALFLPFGAVGAFGAASSRR